MKKIINFSATALIIYVILICVSCIDSNAYLEQSTSIGQNEMVATEENPGLFEVFITKHGFVPENITIHVGMTVTWINKDDTWRAVGEQIPTGESLDAIPLGVSGKLEPGDLFKLSFSVPGIWEYWCPKTLQLGKVFIEEVE